MLTVEVQEKTPMMVSLTDDQNLTTEKSLLSDVFHKETRADGDYYIYHYDQKYYKVLSACAKLRLRTKNLPEGNPNYIEVKATDWDLVFSGQATTEMPESTSNVRHLSFETAKARDVQTLSPQASALRHSNTIFDDGTLQQPAEPDATPTVTPTVTKVSDDMRDEATEENLSESIASLKAQMEGAVAPVIEAPLDASVPFETKAMRFDEIQPSEALPAASAPIASYEAREAPMESSYQDRVASMKTRESVLKTREDAIRIREEAIKAREEALQANEDEIAFIERTVKSKERVLNEKNEHIKALEANLAEQKMRLTKQKKEIAALAEYLQQSADKLLTDSD